MWILILIPFALQALCIAFDEIYFHHKRGLPKWERLGHPLDTLSLLTCLAIALYVPFSPFNLNIFIGLSIFSCLLVTKDEFIHKQHASGAENWLHALLFLLHPITLILTGLIWPISQGQFLSMGFTEFLPMDFDQPSLFSFFLYIQTVVVFIFFLYQVLYWNFLWEPTDDQQ